MRHYAKSLNWERYNILYISLPRESAHHSCSPIDFGAICGFPIGSWRPAPGVNVPPQDTREHKTRPNRIQGSFVFIL